VWEHPCVAQGCVMERALIAKLWTSAHELNVRFSLAKNGSVAIPVGGDYKFACEPHIRVCAYNGRCREIAQLICRCGAV